MLVKFGESATCCAGVGYLDTGVLALKLGFMTEFCCNLTSSLIWVAADFVGSTCAETFLTVSICNENINNRGRSHNTVGLKKRNNLKTIQMVRNQYQ